MDSLASNPHWYVRCPLLLNLPADAKLETDGLAAEVADALDLSGME